MNVLEQQQTAVGQPMRRREDPPLLTGEARYVDDLQIPGALHAVIVRSPVAHARLNAIDTAEAKRAPGVVEVLTGADLASEWQTPLPCAWVVTEDMKNPPHLPLATDEVRHVGDPVAVVVADTRAHAKDAAELVAVDYEDLPVAVDLEAAARDEALVHPDLGTNHCYTWALVPDAEAVEEAFAAAKHTVSERYVHQRLIPSAMEPRGVAVLPSPHGGGFTIYSATQIPHLLKIQLAIVCGIPETKLRVIAPSVGGGFGSKLDVYPEEALCLALAKRLGRPVRWNEERTENAQATIQGRGLIQDMELAADADGRVRAVRVKLLADLGAYLQLVTPGIPLLGAFLYHGVYDVGAYSFECTGVFTNKTPTDAYRGAGRPEATYAIERAMDALARRIGIGPDELRRRNYIRPDAFPYSSVPGLVFDSGNYEPTLTRALELARADEVRSDQASRRASGATKQIGLGISTYVEMCGLAPSRVLASLNFGGGGWEAATVRMLPTGMVQVVTGSSPHGQGHETTWAQVVGDAMGVPPEHVEVLHSDTAISPLGLDTYGSRSLAVGGTAARLAAEKVVAKAKTIAAHQLEASEDDLTFESGVFSVAGSPDRAIPIQGVAFAAFTAHDLPDGVEPNLEAHCTWDPPNMVFPFGTHVCVVEVDTETGAVEVLRYAAVDDCGNQVNPMIVEGQVHGGITQGLAQALFEEAVYDPDGNLVTSTLADYLVPSAADVPSYVTDHTVTPSPTNPMGVKGIGEAGTIGSTPAVVNAVVDALSHLGVTDVAMPCSPQNVFRAIQEAGR